MTEQELLALARELGFEAAMIDPKDVPVNPAFRTYCEENRCGKYNANYSCPPDCGTVEELQAKTQAEECVMVLTAQWQINGYEDKETILRAKKEHNARVLRLMARLRQYGFSGFAAGYGGCTLCDPCKRALNEPCAHPDERISCMSAYCIDVAELAKRCGMAFDWDVGKLYLFGMVAFHRV